MAVAIGSVDPDAQRHGETQPMAPCPRGVAVQESNTKRMRAPCALAVSLDSPAARAATALLVFTIGVGIGVNIRPGKCSAVPCGQTLSVGGTSSSSTASAAAPLAPWPHQQQQQQQQKQQVPLSPEEQHQLVRCSWGSSFLNHAMNVRACSRAFCSGHRSNVAYGQFLFHESLYSAEQNGSAYKASRNLSAYKASRNLLRYSQAQCLFLQDGFRVDSTLATMCVCVYPNLAEFCADSAIGADSAIACRSHVPDDGSRYYVTFKGDSTARMWCRDAASECEEILSESSARLSRSGKVKPKRNKPVQVWVMNEQTLHHLYLPWVRETGENNKSSSIGEFAGLAAAFLQNAEAEAPPGTVLIYYANNEICPSLYTWGYKRTWRWSMERPSLDAFQERARALRKDLPSSLALTLDDYGSAFASELVKHHVMPAFPRVLYMPQVARNPASCPLSGRGDGRHFGNGYRPFKTRLLWHILKSALEMALSEQGPPP